MANQDQDTENGQKEKRGKHTKRVKENLPAPKDESSIAFYLNSSLFVFFVTSWTFAMFLRSNRYPLVLNNEIAPEIIAVFGALFVFSFLSLFLLSFSRFLSRVFISFIAGTAASYLLGLYCSYNVGEYLAAYLSFLPRTQLHSLASGGNFVVGIVFGIVFFVFVNMLKGGAMALLSLPALCALFFIFNDSSHQKIPEVTESKIAAAKPAGEEDKKENLVYLLLSDHAGYAYALEKWQPRSVGAPSEDRSPYFVNDFYQANNFVFYPHVYSRFQDKYRSVGAEMNPSADKVGNDMFARGTSSYYVSSDEARVTLTKNELFKKLKDAGYALNVYQSYPVNFCDGAEGKGIARCVTYPAPLGALYNTDLSLFSKVMLLTGHWMDSFPLGRSLIDWGRNKLLAYKIKVNDLPFFGNPYARSLPIGQAEMLMQLREDVKKSEGKNVFFAHVALPHYPYVYDRFCRLKKDPQTWRSNRAYEGVVEQKEEERRWDSYNQQLFCTYAQLNATLRDWEASGDLKHTKIVIHGDKGASIMPSAKDLLLTAKVDQALERVKRNSSTVFAVYTPDSKKSEIKPSPCDLGSLIRLHLLGEKPDACRLPNLDNFGEEEKAKLEKWLTTPVAGINYKPKEKYAKTYANWLEMGGQAFLSAADRRRRALNGEGMPAKVSFVEPPFAEKADALPKPEKKDAVKTEIVPVPEEKAETLPEMPGETVPALPDEGVPAPEAAETVDVILEETPSAPPKKIELPEIDPAYAQSKWKLVEEAEAEPEKEADDSVEKTENAGMPDASKAAMPKETVPAVEEKTASPDAGIVALPDFGELPAPEAVSAPEVKELPALEAVPAPEVKELPAPEAVPAPEVKELPAPEAVEPPLPEAEMPALPENGLSADVSAPLENTESSVGGIVGLPDFAAPVAEAEKGSENSRSALSETAAEPAVSDATSAVEAVISETEENELTLPALKLGDKASAEDVRETVREVIDTRSETAENAPETVSSEPAAFSAELKTVPVPESMPAPEESASANESAVVAKEPAPAVAATPAEPIAEKTPEAPNVAEMPKTVTKPSESPQKAEAAKQAGSFEEKQSEAPKPEEEKTVASPVKAVETKPEAAKVPEKETPAEVKNIPAEEKETAVPAEVKADSEAPKPEADKPVAAPAKAVETKPDATKVPEKETPAEVKKLPAEEKKTAEREKAVEKNVPSVNKDELDITREIITERISPTTGQKETYIFIERKRNPNRFRKRFPVQKELKEDVLTRSLNQKSLDAKGKGSELKKEISAPVSEKTLSSETAAPVAKEKAAPVSKPAPKPQLPSGRDLGSGGLERVAPVAAPPVPEGRVL